ncbi:MAG: tetraacyldisaccharide 4'-kinase [Minicystis sp.]
MQLVDSLRARLARRLERGDASTPAKALGALWGALASRGLARPLKLPAGRWVIGVGSAVLGGAGKTPLAIALARELARRGERVGLIGHAYRADPGCARVVQRLDRLAEVGDDALCAARALARAGVPVIVAPDRQGALDHAAALGLRVLVVDGLLQSAPQRLAASILVLDEAAPWGARGCPPAGDLRAPREALLAASDHRVLLTTGLDLPLDLPPRAILVPSRIDGAAASLHPPRSLAELSRLRCGLFLTVARPARIVTALRRAGIAPAPIVTLADHARPSRAALARAARAPVDCWLTTARCAVKLPEMLGDAPVLVLEHRLEVGALVEGLLPFF